MKGEEGEALRGEEEEAGMVQPPRWLTQQDVASPIATAAGS